MKKAIINKIIITFFFLLCPLIVKASDGSLYLSGDSSLYPSSDISVSLGASVSGNLMGVGGNVSTSDASCISISSISNVAAGTDSNGSTISFLSMNGITGGTLFKFNVHSGGNPCSATIRVSNLTLDFTDGNTKNQGTISKTISVIEPPSGNNDLSSLNVSEGSLSPNFSSGNTNYSVSVGSDVSTINISASASDNGASISGTGTKKLSYGNNEVGITVRAPNGSKKTYVVNINRKDSRSDNNLLKSLTLSNGTLSPKFNGETTNYDVEVPYDVSIINMNASAEDSKATINYNNQNLEAEATTVISVVVTAENGTKRTYTINVTRGKDPNKVLSNDNKLVSITSSTGVLSPAFNKDKNNYYLYLPYEIDNVDFNYEISDKKYAKVEVSKPESLQAGMFNKFVFTVTSEDGSTNNYTVSVFRGQNPDVLENSDSKLKNIILTNGKLAKAFNSDGYFYYFSKGKDFSFDYELMDDSASVKVIDNGNIIYFVVSAPNGDMSVYTLYEKENYTIYIIVGVLVIIVLLVIGYLKFKDSAKFKELIKKFNIKKLTKK